MKPTTTVILLFALNLALLLLLSAKPPQQTFQKITVQEFELVDKNGQVRANIIAYPEGEVVLRLKDSKGNVRVKLGANDDGSGLVLLNNSTDVGIHALAKDKGSSVSVVNPNGKKLELKPESE
ncbi:MAG: hypothetical protein U0Y10_04765 [Spirosomataceae bacterium]